MYLLALIVYFAVFAQALVSTDKRNYAIITTGGATLADCRYSILNERALNRQYLVSYMPHEMHAFCRNPDSQHCDTNIGGWKVEGCIQRFDAYYRKGHAPSYDTSFDNSHGTCIFKPHGQDAGGTINYADLCPCQTVGLGYANAQCQT